MNSGIGALFDIGSTEEWSFSGKGAWGLRNGKAELLNARPPLTESVVELRPIAREKDLHLHKEILLPFQEGAWLEVSADILSEEPGKVGLNVYIEKNGNRTSHSKNHPGHGEWETVKHRHWIPGGNGDATITFMVVVRAGSERPTQIKTIRAAHSSLDQRPSPSTPNNDQNTPSLPDAAHYRVSQEFYDAILAWNRKHPAASDPRFLDKIDRYHLGGNLKGMKTVRTIEKISKVFGSQVKGGRFLDLGCGTGGCLVAAYERGASYCEGWEINEEKIRFAKLNLDTLARVPNRVSVLKKSMDDATQMDEIVKPFEIVCCEQVLEHVKDLETSFATLADVIDSETGIAYITVPNGFSLHNVLEDPHLLVYGLSLLDRREGGILAKAVKNHTHYAEMMGSFLWYDDYVSHFQKNELTYVPIHSIEASHQKWADLERKLERIETLRKERLNEWSEKVPSETIELLSDRLSQYVSKTRIRFNEARSKGRNHESSMRFMTDYGVDTFEFILFRKGNVQAAKAKVKSLQKSSTFSRLAKWLG